jgi:ribose 5-phosphate isomerase B
VLRAAEAVSGDLGAFGIVLGGSGNGEQMAANKVRGIRAALAYNVETAELARTHNDAQVLSIGARMNTLDEAKAMVETFLTTTFSGDARHARRLAMVDRYEQNCELPPVPAAEG